MTRTRIFACLLALLWVGNLHGQEQHTITEGETLSKILRNKGYPGDYQTLLPYINQIVSLNSTLLDRGADYLLPGTSIIMPDNPFKVQPVAVPEPEVVEIEEEVVEIEPEVVEIEVVNYPVARTEIKKGSYYLLRNNERIDAYEEEFLYQGDYLITSKDSIIHVHFIDESIYKVGANSKFKIKEFDYEKGTSRTQGFTSILRFIFGSIAVKTGIIGVKPNDNYQFVTPLATLGVRGTEYTVRYCEGDACGSYAGISVAVVDGEVIYQNNATIINLTANQFVHTTSIQEVPVITTVPDDFLNLEEDIIELKDPRSWWQKILDAIVS